ncbi:hypothetical protein GJV06_12395 [Enterobacteriaceae bacterium RIT691]|nr:hypothetical protein [Enterobacteriaceae bacterium RIT691]
MYFYTEGNIPVLRSLRYALPELTEYCDFFEVTRCKFQLKPLRALAAVSRLLSLLTASKTL